MSKICSNTGYYDPPIWTCPECFHELGNIGEGQHVCPKCSTAIVCKIEHIPDFVTETVDDDED